MPRIEVPDSPARPAHEVVMDRDIGIIPDEVATIDLDRHALPLEPVKIAIDRPKADTGKPLPDEDVKLVGPGMGLELPQLIENDLPLAGAPLLRGFGLYYRSHEAPK